VPNTRRAGAEYEGGLVPITTGGGEGRCLIRRGAGANYEGGLVVPKVRGWFQNKMGSWSQI
jgi:hypothetical protein